MQQQLVDLLRHPLTGELPAGFRKARPSRGEVGPQPFYRIAGAEDETPEEKAAREEAEADAASGRTFTQAELNAKLTAEKRQGKSAATRELMEKFGFESVEQAEAFINERREADDKKKTEAERAADEVKAEKAKAEKERRDAATERRQTRIESALIRLGVDAGDEDDDDDEGDLPDAIALISRDLADDADVDDIRAAAKKLKERRPELFAETTESSGTKTTKGRMPDGKGGKRTKPPVTKPGAAGRARAERRGWTKPDTKD